MRRLIPDPGPTTVPEQVIQLDLISSAPEDRPYLVTNFAVTVDGKATLHGRSGKIGSDRTPRCWSASAPAWTR